MKPAGKQEPRSKAGRFNPGSASRTKLKPYGSKSFAGRPLQTSPKPQPKTGSDVQNR